MIRAVCFDIGNTLFFYNYAFLSNLLKERFEIDIDARELEAVHYALGEIIQAKVRERQNHTALVNEVYTLWMKDLAIDAERIPRVVELISGHPFPHMFWARMGEGVRETLDWFRGRHLKMAVISNAEGQIRQLLKHVGLYDYFDAVLDSKEVGLEKPDPRIFEEAVKQLAVEPHETVHIGDLVAVDIEGARRAGMVPVLVDREDRYPDIDCLRVRRISEVIDLPVFEEHR